jgi:hypothetical protein
MAKVETLRCVGNMWPMIVLEGSGGLADEISMYHRLREDNPEILLTIDPQLAEIVERGNINSVHVLVRGGGAAR